MQDPFEILIFIQSDARLWPGSMDNQWERNVLRFIWESNNFHPPQREDSAGFQVGTRRIIYWQLFTKSEITFCLLLQVPSCNWSKLTTLRPIAHSFVPVFHAFLYLTNTQMGCNDVINLRRVTIVHASWKSGISCTYTTLDVNSSPGSLSPCDIDRRMLSWTMFSGAQV